MIKAYVVYDKLNTMHHDALFMYDRRVYELAGGPKQVWYALMVAIPESEVFALGLEKTADVAERRNFHYSLYYTGPALLYESITNRDTWRFERVLLACATTGDTESTERSFDPCRSRRT